MNIQDIFSFEETPWERFSAGLGMGDTVSAVEFLTLLEGETEEAVEDAFRLLEDLSITLDIEDLPRPGITGETGKRLALEERLAAQGKLHTGLSDGDPLKLYLDELAMLPVCGDVALLAGELARANRDECTDAPVQQRMLELSLSRVVELAAEYTGRGVLLMDLIQEGSMGLWQGILAYTEGLDIEKVRDWWITHYMTKAVVLQARENGVGSKLRRAMEDYREVDERLLSDLGRNATTEEIARELHMTQEEVLLIRQMLDSARLIHRARGETEPPEETEDDTRHVEDTAYFQMRQRITELLSGLAPEDAQLLTLRFGLEGGLPLSPEDTGAKLGLTAQEVITREAAALARLRK